MSSSTKAGLSRNTIDSSRRKTPTIARSRRPKIATRMRSDWAWTIEKVMRDGWITIASFALGACHTAIHRGISPPGSP
jgi:hypothetical protein